MANAYLVPGGNGIMNDPSNWSTTSGGASGYTLLTGDDLIIDANSMNAPLATRSGTYNSITFTNYTGLFTLTQILTISQTYIYSPGMTTTGTATISVGSALLTTATINFNGVTHSGAFSFNNGSSAGTTYTIIGDMNVIGTVNFVNGNLSGSGTKITINGGNVLCNAGLGIFGNGNRWLSGSSTIYFVGSGSGNFTSGVSAFFQNMSIVFAKTGGTINMTSGSLYTRGTNITYISGNFTNFLLAVNTNSATLNTNSMIWSAVSIGGGTLTNNSTLNIANSFNIGTNNTINGVGDIYCNTLTNTTSFGLAVGKSLFINSSWTSVATAASPFLIYSASTGTQVNIVLATNATQDIAHTNARDINSNGGKTIYSYRVASLVNTLNWATLPIITTVNTKTIAI